MPFIVYKLASVTHAGKYTLHVSYQDGLSGTIDCSELLRGPIFEPLKNEKYFAQVKIYPELETIYWDNGADIAPETLREKVEHVSRR